MNNPIDLEGVVIGSLLLRPDAFYELPAQFNAKALVSETARRVYAAVEELLREKKPADLPLVATRARLSQPQTQWLREALDVGTTNSVAPYAEQLLTEKQKRDLLAVAREIPEMLRTRSVEESRDAILAKLLGGDDVLDDWVDSRDVSLRFIDEIEREKRGVSRLIRTGFPMLDSLVQLQPGSIGIVAALTGKGKTVFALNIAEHNARIGKRVLFHCLEMRDVELIGRIVSRNARVNSSKMFGDDEIDQAEWRNLSAAATDAGTLPILWNTKHHGLDAICRITEKAHRKHALDLCIVDYVQLISHNSGRDSSEEKRIGDISRSLKLLAQRLELPILCLAQMNNDSIRRGDEGKPATPRTSDMRGSARIVHDASLVMFLHEPDESLSPRQMMLVIAKSRFTARDAVLFRADLAHAQFIELRMQ